jgi:hypothetical protein
MQGRYGIFSSLLFDGDNEKYRAILVETGQILIIILFG